MARKKIVRKIVRKKRSDAEDTVGTDVSLSLQVVMSELGTRLKDVVKDLMDEIEERNDLLEDKHKLIEELKANLEGKTSENTTTENQDDVDPNDVDPNDLQTPTLTQLGDVIDKLEARTMTLEEENSDLEGEIDELQSKVTDLECELSEAEAHVCLPDLADVLGNVLDDIDYQIANSTEFGYGVRTVVRMMRKSVEDGSKGVAPTYTFKDLLREEKKPERVKATVSRCTDTFVHNEYDDACPEHD